MTRKERELLDYREWLASVTPRSWPKLADDSDNESLGYHYRLECLYIRSATS